ncbi:short-chain dehydrogenase/reductase family 16C member 6 [Drosophila persimilis]|uniref:short-chain dehydrogenase/reductase family 16C member 6 n=1 Tax=Drosophila persimilis TaxID=7234 RepID=UPI000708693C|nr:short-chain dehydrogenase/reductase family 16C member 6 [Drosophila persimilis]XP_026844372.1 short-chain dehydrogenase/reductase family 16C member 6 [Drosophila persimilis]
MIEREIIHTTTASKRIFDVLQDFVQFLLLFLRIFLEMFVMLIQKVLPKRSLKDISGEVVLITGTGHGIGRELALHYASLGSTVVCVDINEKNNLQTVQKAKRLNLGDVHSFICDVSKREEVLALADRVKTDPHIGPISVLVNNVGIMPTHPILQQSAEEIQRVFDVNVFSQFWTIQAFLSHMEEKNRGHIIALSSIAGVVGLSNLVPYCATKFAVRGLMEALHEELREGPYKNMIKTTTIFPYMTNTGLCKHPKVKFPSILGLLDPKEVARRIVEAHRSDTLEATIPSCLLHINNWTRLLPDHCGLMLKDYIDSGVESDLI